MEAAWLDIELLGDTELQIEVSALLNMYLSAFSNQCLFVVLGVLFISKALHLEKYLRRIVNENKSLTSSCL